MAVIQSASFIGPLPPPSLFGKYDEILPGSANRILELTEREQRQRHDWDNRSFEFKNKETSRGQILGFGLGLSAIIASVVCAYFGQTWVAIFVIGSTSLLGTITAYIKFFSKANTADHSN